jgi:hypothetical protein
MKKTVAIALVVILLSMGLVAGTASADESASQSGEAKLASLDSMDFPMALDGVDPPMALDGTWVILDQYMKVGEFFSGGPWTWDSPALSVKFTITDLYVVSDQFEVYDNGVPVVTTPSLTDWDVLGYTSAFTSPPWTADPDTALASGFFSSAVITFPPGKHSITIKDIHIPPRFAGGRPCSDGTVAFKAEHIDNIEPLSITSLIPNSAIRGTTLTVMINGNNLDHVNGVSFGSGVTVNDLTVVSSSQVDADIDIDTAADLGSRDVTVSSPDGTTTLADGFMVNEFILQLTKNDLIIKPEALKVNPGIFTAFVVFPSPYDALTIADAVADGAPHTKINFDPSEHKAIIKFERKDITVLRVDTHFEIWGHFIYNGATCQFMGSDDIQKVHEDEAPPEDGSKGKK